MCILCYSCKKHSIEVLKVKAHEFDITGMTFRLKAPTADYVNQLLPDDPKELYIALNEFAYHISNDSKDSVSACY